MQRDRLLLAEMIDAATEAHRLASETTVEDLAADRTRRDALLWNFTVLGEAANQLTDELKAQHATVPWQQPTRLRNRIVHGYWAIDLDILHNTALRQLPSFAEQLQQVLDSLDGAEPSE